MIVRHVLIGGLFTIAGLVPLMTPSFRFICIGALIFGPIELMIGLFGNDRRNRGPRPMSAGTIDRTGEASIKLCGSCGMKSDPTATFCSNCGAQFASARSGTKG